MVRSKAIYLHLKHAEINSSRLPSQSKILVKVELTISFGEPADDFPRLKVDDCG